MSGFLPPDESRPPDYDPVYLNSRREALVIFGIFIAGLVWAVPYCYLTGYIGDFERGGLSTTLGIPTWLFWGIAVPWLIADLVTVWFCFFYMADDDLGVGPEQQEEIRPTEPASRSRSSDGSGDPTGKEGTP